MKIMETGLENIIIKNLSCVEEGLINKQEAYSEIVNFINSNFIAFNDLGLAMNFGQLEKLKTDCGFHVASSGNSISLSKDIQIYKKRGERDGVQ